MNSFFVVKQRLWLSAVFVFIVLFSKQSLAAGVQLYSDVYLLSPVTQISKVEDGWEPKGTGSYMQAKARLGSRLALTDNWSVGVHKRLDYLVHFDQATSDFYSAIENNELPAGQYPLHLRVNAIRSHGFEVSRIIPLSSIVPFTNDSDLVIRSSLLSGNRVQDGLLTGAGAVAENGDISYQYNLDYFYDEQRLLDSEEVEVNGWGHSFDVHWKGIFARGYSVSLELNDLFYRMYWQELDHDAGCLVRPLSVNPACSVAVQPRDHRQVLPSHTRGQISKRFEGQGFSGDLSLEAEYWSRYDAVWVSWAQSDFMLGFEVQNQIYRLGYESAWLKVKYQFDHLVPKSAHFGRLSMSLYWPL